MRVRSVRILPMTAGLCAWGALAAPGAAAQEQPGKALFEGKGACFACHGPGAKGTPVGPDLTDGEWLHFEERPTLEAVIELVKQGVASPIRFAAPMPPRGGSSLTDEELEAVARYVVSLSEEAGRAG